MNAGSNAIRVATVTVSDTQTTSTDEPGRLCRQLLTEAGYALARDVVIKDDPKYIEEILRDLVDGNACEAIVLLSGSTVSTARDNAQGTLEKMFEARMDGFGEAFRRLAWEEWGPVGVLARSLAGTVNGCVVFSTPNSTDAVRLGMTKLILPLLPQLLGLAQGAGQGSPASPPASL